MPEKEADEGGRCPFLLENDDSKIVICMCNYYSLGQAELARALLQIIATRDLPKALQVLRKIIWYGPPKHWLCSVLVPSSAHLAWLCLIDFQDLVKRHLGKPAQLPPWLLKHLEFDVLLAQALLDGAAIFSQVLTAEVAGELREYHAGLLCATSLEHQPELQVPASLKLPALSLLQVTNQVSPFVNFLPALSMQRQEQVENFKGSKTLSKVAVQQLYDLCRSQPLLGRCICLSLAPVGCAAALPTARRIQQMYLGLTADALLQSLKSDAWRFLKFLEVNDSFFEFKKCPQSLLELLSVLLVVVVTDVRPTPALHGRLQALVSMATSTGQVADDGEEDAETLSGRILASFAQAMVPETGGLKPWDQLRRLVAHQTGASPTAGSSTRYTSLLQRIRGDARVGKNEDEVEDAHVDRSLAEAWEEHGKGPLEAARNAFLHRAKIYEAFLTHASNSHAALRLFSTLEDKLLRLKSSQSSLPPAFEVCQLLDPATYSFKEPPITFWDAYFEFTRVAGEHCLEYVINTASEFIRKRDFLTAAWLLAPFPQLKPLVVLLCWEEFRRDVESLQHLLDTLWKSYVEETFRDSSKVGDLLVDHWVEVLNYRLFAAGWISKVVETSKPTAPVNEVAADVLEAITSHSLLYVMRPQLPMVESHLLLSSLQSLPQLRQQQAAFEHSYDLDLAHCYYTVRCALCLIAKVQEANDQAIQDSIQELDSLMSCIERTPLKVSVFLFLSSLCFARQHHLQAATAGEDFLVPPKLLLSLVVLLQHHLEPLKELAELQSTVRQLKLFTQETIWRISISLKDYFFYSELSKARLDSMRTAAQWAEALGAVVLGKMELPTLLLDEVSSEPLRRYCTPMEVPLSLMPSFFIPRMLASPGTLLQRSLKMNDYALSRELLGHFPGLRGGQIEAAVRMAEQFKELRERLMSSSLDSESLLIPETEGVEVLTSLSQPLLCFYVLVDLAVSAAPLGETSTQLLKRAFKLIPEVPEAMQGFFQTWLERLQVLVEVRPELRDKASLASFILGIETLPSEPALLKSHLNRLHTQRHAILSLVESVDLVKKGQTSASQRTLVDFLSSAITSFNREEEGTKVADEEAVQISEGLGSSRYLLRFLEYLARVADLMHSAQDARHGLGEEETEAGVTKLFDVLAEPPKAIVARLLFELQGHRQALVLSEIMNIDMVEVIVNSSFKCSEHTMSSPQYAMSMEVVEYLAQHEHPLPSVMCTESPLLATLACLECRAHRWPSWSMLFFAKEKSQSFPALHRWVEERLKTLQAIQCADANGYTQAEFAKLSREEQLALSAAGDDQEACMSAAYTQVVNGLIAEGRHELALEVCDEHLPVESALTDRVLHLYLNSPQAPEMDGKLLDHECMYRVKSQALAAQLTLDRYKRWDVDTAVQTLSMCLQRLEQREEELSAASRVAALKQELRRILQRMTAFGKILEASNGRWRVWQDIEEMSKAEAQEAVEHLLSLQQHDMARTLAQMYGMTDPLHSLELSRLHYLFTKKNDKTQAVNRLLSLPPSQAVSFALQLLDMFDVIQHRGLLCQMLLSQLPSWLSPAEEERLRVLLASLQLLQEVSERMQPHFQKLLRKPELIVESLLMNARVDLLKKFLEDFPEYRHDELILRYVRKALALPTEPPEAHLEALDASEPLPEGLGGAWCLTCSPRDAEIRQRHRFVEAPSSILAERILNLCSDRPENAAKCFGLCDELSLQLYDLTTGCSAAGVSTKLSSFLIRRLLSYLLTKFQGGEVQRLQQSLQNLDFMPELWHVLGRVGLKQLCDPVAAAELRDTLIAEDHLTLALELCGRCDQVSADPVREARAMALQRLSRFAEARQEFNTGCGPSQGALTAFEDAMRYPPLYDLAALEQQRCVYSFNSLQRKLYRSTASMASLPIFLQNSDQAVPIVPISKPPESESSTMHAALEDRLYDALQRRRGRSEVREVQETTLVNSVTFLTPPIHPSEMSRWSTLTDLVALRASSRAEAVEVPLEEPARPAGEEKPKERTEEVAEDAADVSVGGTEDEAHPDVSYDQLTMDMRSVCCGCSGLHQLRSPSNLWPEERSTHGLMCASPMALPSAAPPKNASGFRALSAASFRELLQFQDKYGTAESLISLLVREQKLAQACQYIFSEKVNKRLFVDVVAHHCLAHNQFHELQKVILDFDPSLRTVHDYLSSVKEFLRDRRALDLLYSYEVFTKNYVKAGTLAIQLFLQSMTWDARVGHLSNALAHLFSAQKLRKREQEEEEEPQMEEISRTLDTVRLQLEVCEAMPCMPSQAVLFTDTPAQCEVAELLMVQGHFKLAQRVIDFLELPAVELCIRASNQIATQQARQESGSIAPVVRFLQAIPKLPPVEWDSLVSNVVNIWIIEKEELNGDRSAASQLVPYIQDERCKMDALILIGNLSGAFQIAQRLGSVHDVLYINSKAQAIGDHELLKSIAAFMAYNPVKKA